MNNCDAAMRNILFPLLLATITATAAYSQRAAGSGEKTDAPVHLIIRYQAEKIANRSSAMN